MRKVVAVFVLFELLFGAYSASAQGTGASAPAIRTPSSPASDASATLSSSTRSWPSSIQGNWKRFSRTR